MVPRGHYNNARRLECFDLRLDDNVGDWGHRGPTQWATMQQQLDQLGSGSSHGNDEIRDNVERMRCNQEAYADALATVLCMSVFGGKAAIAWAYRYVCC
jgi:hypothetical protein